MTEPERKSMSNDRLEWILKYQFASEYASEGLWNQAFEKFKKDLKAYDDKVAKND